MNVLFTQEPDFTIEPEDPEYSHKLLLLLQYAHAVITDKELKKATEIRYGELLEDAWKNIPDFEFKTLGKICWILNNGGLLSIDDLRRAESMALSLKDRYSHVEVETFIDPYMTMNRRIFRAINHIDLMITSSTLNIEILKTIKGSNDQASLDSIKDHYMDLLSGAPDDWKITINEVLGVLSGKPVVTTSKLIFGPKDKADALVLHSMKDDRIILLVAEPGKKLSLKGKKIINWSDADSYSKKMKNPDMDLKAITSAGDLKRVQTILTQGITGKKAVPKNRISEFVQIRKIFQ